MGLGLGLGLGLDYNEKSMKEMRNFGDLADLSKEAGNDVYTRIKYYSISQQSEAVQERSEFLRKFASSGSDERLFVTGHPTDNPPPVKGLIYSIYLT